MLKLSHYPRHAVLAFLNASPDEYAVIFTANASGALKLVGESYPFTAGSQFLLTVDNHNSVNGIREFARSRGGDVVYMPFRGSDLRLDDAQVLAPSVARRGAGETCSGTPLSPTTRGSATRSTGWTGPTSEGGTCCWMHPRSYPQTAST